MRSSLINALKPLKLKRKAKTVFLKLARAKLRISSRRQRQGNSFHTGEGYAYDVFGRGFREHFPERIIKGPAGRNYFIRFGAGRFESDQAVDVFMHVDGANHHFLFGWLNLGFEKRAVIVESMQTDFERKKYLNEFRRITKKGALDFLLEETEKTAKQLEFKEIKIRHPETLEYFQDPLLDNGLDKKQTQRQMKILYQRIALRHGYKPNGAFFIKSLN